MPRTPSIWLRAQTGWYCTKVRGVVHKLARTEVEARKAFYKLMAKDSPVPSRKPDRHSARWLCDKFLDRTKDAKQPDTWRVQFSHLKAFCDSFGSRPADSLKVHEINEWLDGTDWGASTKALAVQVVKAAFNWAAAEDYLTENPLKKVRRRKIARRERVLSAAEKDLLLGGAEGEFKDFLTVLAETGMRPFSEAAKLSAAGTDWEQGRAVLGQHKNKGKGKTRVVYFAPSTLAVLRRLARLYPEGLLFRNNRGNSWKKDTIHDRLKRLCDSVGVPGKDVNVYTLRHTYITDALIQGVAVEVVAELVGTSPKMIHSNYASIDKKVDALRAAAAKALG